MSFTTIWMGLGLEVIMLSEICYREWQISHDLIYGIFKKSDLIQVGSRMLFTRGSRESGIDMLIVC